MNVALEVHNLIKRYDKNTVLKGISFQVMAGEIFALLGTNGAGKTTALECIEHILNVDDGNIKVVGKLGVQTQSSSLPPNIKAIEAINLFAKWNHINVDYDYLYRLGIMDFDHELYRKLSTGQKRRLHLAIALLGDPDIVILDEPTAGLDVEGRVAIHEEIKKLKEKGKSILMASHDMSEVEELCDKIAILKDGYIAFCGTPSEIINQLGNERIIHIQSEKGMETITTNDICETLLLRLNDYKENNKLVLDIKIEQASLEERFIEIAREEI